MFVFNYNSFKAIDSLLKLHRFSVLDGKTLDELEFKKMFYKFGKWESCVLEGIVNLHSLFCARV